mmetsp:Transcript_65195/g.108124  ORF Transcript_65195/g.108124 Transcript_65195/m.108124 type:complete len:208 (-) Transcript_65195:50-673(-)
MLRRQCCKQDCCGVSPHTTQNVLDEMKKFLKKPVRLLAKKKELTLEGVRQFYVALEQEWRKDTLLDLLELFTNTQAIIYCNTRRKVEYLANELRKCGLTVSVMHADLDQCERESIMQSFVPGSPGVLISTDLLARGSDVHMFPLVINFDLPCNMENYLHRVGRSGHFYKKGIAINLVAQNDVRTLRDIQTYYATQIEELPMDAVDYI